MDHMGMMKNYFHGGYEEQFMFKQLHIDNGFKMVLTCGILFKLTLLLEAIKYMRTVRCGCQIPKQRQQAEYEQNGEQSETRLELAHTCYVGRQRTRRHRLFQSLLHAAQTTIGFTLMLAVMSFNVCIIFAIILGTGVGYYIFYRPYSDVEDMDSCH